MGLLSNHLEVYQVHSATLESGLFDDSELIHALAALKSEGICVGLTLSGPRQAETLLRAAELSVDGRRLFGSVQATWNILEISAGEALRQAHREGLGVIVKEALANGRLTSRNVDPDFGAKLALLQRRRILPSSKIGRSRSPVSSGKTSGFAVPTFSSTGRGI